MKDQIVRRIEELTNEIDELLSERQELVSRLKSIDEKVNGKSHSIMELKKLLEDHEE